MLLLAGSAAVLFLGLYLLDCRLQAPTRGNGFFGSLFAFDRETAQNALGNLAQVIAAVLGIAITVVSIVVQLAATRYTPRVPEMFFRDRTNLFVMGFFVVACIDAVWVSLSVSQRFMPDVSIAVTLVIVTVSLLLLVPYFAYVFHFLDPERIIVRIRQQALKSALDDRAATEALQGQVLVAVEQLGDIAINALSNKDRIIASHAVDALRDLATTYVPEKARGRAAWFALGPAIRANPDFAAMGPEVLAELEAARSWLEWKVLRQFQEIYSEALRSGRDLAHRVAIGTRLLAETAMPVPDRDVLDLSAKFMNTFLRATLNARDARAAYNLLNQYRLLIEAILRAGDGARAHELAGRLKYYAQTAQAMNLEFVTETTAYDLAALCELAFELGAPIHEALLRVLLEVDKPAETAEQESSLRGVRKAQAKLATFYLARGAEPFARQIWRDMSGERVERLRSIRDELQAVQAKDFWEATDRASNFDYLEPVRREKLGEFFGWFARLDEPAPPKVEVVPRSLQ